MIQGMPEVEELDCGISLVCCNHFENTQCLSAARGKLSSVKYEVSTNNSHFLACCREDAERQMVLMIPWPQKDTFIMSSNKKVWTGTKKTAWDYILLLYSSNKCSCSFDMPEIADYALQSKPVVQYLTLNVVAKSIREGYINLLAAIITSLVL